MKKNYNESLDKCLFLMEKNMSQCLKCSKIRQFFLLLINGFPLVREIRVRRKLRQKRMRMQKLIKDEPKKLRRYVIQSGTIRRL